MTIPDSALDGFTRSVIRRKARSTCRRSDLSETDFEDLRQELTLRVLEGLPHFDAAIAHHNVFVVTIVERATLRFLRDRRTKKRANSSTCSLDALLRDEDEGSNSPLAIEDSAEGTDLELDLADWLESLPPDLQDLARRLRWKPLSGVARDLGLPRTTLQRRLRLLRERAEEAGFQIYC